MAKRISVSPSRAVARSLATPVARSVASFVAGAPDAFRYDLYLVDDGLGGFEPYNDTDGTNYAVRRQVDRS